MTSLTQVPVGGFNETGAISQVSVSYCHFNEYLLRISEAIRDSNKMDTVQLFGPRNTLKFVLWGD